MFNQVLGLDQNQAEVIKAWVYCRVSSLRCNVNAECTQSHCTKKPGPSRKGVLVTDSENNRPQESLKNIICHFQNCVEQSHQDTFFRLTLLTA